MCIRDRITGEIRRFLRDDGMVKVSRSIKENAVKSMRVAGQLRDTLGCEPTVEQIAAACELSVEDITLSMSASMEVESIYKTIYQGDGSEVMLMDKLEDKADIGETASSKVALAQLMETLSQRENCLLYTSAVTGGLINTYVIGMIVSNICIIIAAFFAVKCLKKQTSIKEEYTMIMPVLLFMAPYTFYCSSVYTEAMFIMFIVLFFYFLFEKKYMAAGIMAACSSGTRIVGCILVFALVVQLYIDMRCV